MQGIKNKLLKSAFIGLIGSVRVNQPEGLK